MLAKILIANRGEIAVRIAATARRMGIKSVAIYSDADAQALHVKSMDEAYRVGPAPARESYLNAKAIITIAKQCGAEAIHPGYGFLSENPDFAEAVARAGLVFIGPPASAIRAMGLKDKARVLMKKAGVPVLPGYDGENQDTDHLAHEAARIGFPVLIKPVAGGGGKGMHRIDDPGRFAEALASAKREAKSSFGDDRVLIEKFLPRARHIEIQIFADGGGQTIHLFERDCSLQRRHQKVIEEAPAPGMTKIIRENMGKAAVAAAKAVAYVGAGTVEFIADVSGGLRKDRFYFMEMNTRLQVEHPVTEMITGLDLVEWQLRVAAGEKLPRQDLAISGHAIEARLYAEDPARNFQPQTGALTHLEFPEGIRVDTGVEQGDGITPYYDPMIAKLIAHGETRDEAQQKLAAALTQTRIGGCRTNLAFLSRLLRHPAFISGDVDTGFVEHLTTGDELPPEALAAALLHSLGYLAEPATASPFDTLRGLELWRSERSVEGIAATLIAFGAGKFELKHAGNTIPLALRHSGERRNPALEIQNRTIPFTIFQHDHVLTVYLENSIHEFSLPHSSASQGADVGDAGNLVTAPMPGLLAVLNVQPGDRLAKGDTVAVIEAMKMEFTLRAPCSGKIAKVSAAAGDQVEEGAVIAMIEESDG